MKTLIASLALTLGLVGCVTNPPIDKDVAVKYKYIVLTIPDEMLEIPANTPAIDPNVATDKDTGKWMLKSEGRALDVQARLKAIKAFQAKRLKALQEDQKIPKEDILIK